MKLINWIRSLFNGGIYFYGKPAEGHTYSTVEDMIAYEENKKWETINQYDNMLRVERKLEQVYNEEAYAEYAGGTLCIKFELCPDDFGMTDAEDVYLLTTNKRADVSDEAHFWVCMCYLKYRGGNDEKVKDCVDFITTYKGADFAADVVLRHCMA